MNPGTPNDDGKIRITLDDLNRVPEATPPEAAGASPRTYGNIAENPLATSTEASSGSLLMKGWCYLGLAGMAGAVLAWAICEPRFVDGPGATWANHILFPLMLVLVCAGFGVAESVVEHSPRKAAMRGLMSLGLGTVLGFIFFFMANVIFSIGLQILAQMGGLSVKNPGFWITRGIAWMGFGAAGGVVYGIVGQSGRKCLYGIAGGVLGAGLGGFVFDPIALAMGGAGASRGVGMALFGLATGVAMGLVESALKDRWLYVSAGPLSGKQFILYKPLTTIGSSQACEIYLFKDPTVLSAHATIELRGPRAILHASGPVYVQGRPVHEAALESGNSIQIGRYSFLYRDRERVGR
jgi:hypothetical protein